MSLMTLPSDALRTILVHLHPSDITRLQTAFPPYTLAHTLTRDPHLWHLLYQAHFPRATGPHPNPLVTVTADGRLDWQSAYFEARRRQHAVQNARTPRPRPRNPPDTARAAQRRVAPQSTDDGQLRVLVDGNIRRIVSSTAHQSSANVIWDASIAAARFDWSVRPSPVQAPPRCPRPPDVAMLRRARPNHQPTAHTQ